MYFLAPAWNPMNHELHMHGLRSSPYLGWLAAEGWCEIAHASIHFGALEGHSAPPSDDPRFFFPKLRRMLLNAPESLSFSPQDEQV